MKKDLWIQNMSDRLISLGDLGILLQPYQSANILDPKHYQLTEKQVMDSLASGSLYRRSDKIVVRQIPPAAILKGAGKIQVETKQEYPSKVRSLLVHKEFNYDELQISDEEYAKDNADLADIDDAGKYRK